MKNLIKKIYKFIGIKLGLLEENVKNDKAEQLYQIGNVKIHNSLVDKLIPQAVIIGDNFISAPNSIILAHDASTYNHTKKHRIEKTIIGNDVFLGAGAIILPGVHVGDGAIIGAGAIVTKNVKSYTVVVGNPAKYICEVKDYMQKCETRGVLFDTPKSFSAFYDNKLTKQHVEEFQKSYLKQVKNEKS